MTEAIEIVTADDDEVVRQLVEFKLTNAGYELTVFDNGVDCWDYLRENPAPDLVILDIMMPGMSGLQVLQRIRETDSIDELPVIMLTSRGREENVVEGIESGATEYLTKPFSPNELLARARRHVE